MTDKRTDRTISPLDRKIIVSHSTARVTVSESVVERHRVGVYVRNGKFGSDDQFASAHLTPSQARKMAIALIEYAAFIDNRKVA